MNDSELKPRRPWVAILLGLIAVPAGYLYIGHKRGGWATLVWLTIAPAFMFLICKVPLPRIAICSLLVFAAVAPFLFLIDIWATARKKTLSRILPFQTWWGYLIAIVVAIISINGVIYITRNYIGETFIVPGRALAPIINHNDRIFVDYLWFDAADLQRNDLALFVNRKREFQLNVMRVVGLPGEMIEIKDEKLLIDGKEIDDQYAHFTNEVQRQHPEMTDYGPTRIPRDSYFVLGDNRRLSRDSRIDGPVHFDDFRGVPKIVYWSKDYRFSTGVSLPPKRGKIRWDRVGLGLGRQ